MAKISTKHYGNRSHAFAQELGFAVADNCYEVKFDLESNLEQDIQFEPPHRLADRKLQLHKITIQYRCNATSLLSPHGAASSSLWTRSGDLLVDSDTGFRC